MPKPDIYTQSAMNYDYIGEAWQYKVRKAKAAEESGRPYWEALDLTVANSIVHPVSFRTAKLIVEEYEWLGVMPAGSCFYYGIFFKDKETRNEVCGGVVVYANEYVENFGTWDRYGYTGKILLLARGVCLHWTPKNTNSRLIMESMKQLPPRYEVITCTIDNLAGEVGTIYQACNFVYVGDMHGYNRGRTACVIEGKLYGDRALISKFGTKNHKKILELRPDATFIKQKGKDRYFYFRGSRKTRAKNRKAIESMIKPYPKRSPYDEAKELKTYPAKAAESSQQSLF